MIDKQQHVFRYSLDSVNYNIIIDCQVYIFTCKSKAKNNYQIVVKK